MRAAPLALAALLAACAGEEAERAAAPPEPRSAVEGLPAPETGEALPEPSADAAQDSPRRERLRDPAARAPEIYMDLQRDSAGLVSVIFATDASRDGTPGDDPAIRLSPEGGECNPQQMRRYAFPDGAAPVFGPPEASRGLTAADLPAFMAVAATETMLARGLAADREDTRPQNICTRKLWERLVTARTGQ